MQNRVIGHARAAGLSLALHRRPLRLMSGIGGPRVWPQQIMPLSGLMHAACLLGAVAAAAAAASGARPAAAAAAIACELTASGSYTCTRAGAVVATSAPIAVYLDNSWHVAGTASLRPGGKGLSPLKGTDKVGPYTGARLEWEAVSSTGAPAVPFTTAIKNYGPALPVHLAAPCCALLLQLPLRHLCLGTRVRGGG